MAAGKSTKHRDSTLVRYTTSMTTKPNTYVALLRGINVGGHTIVSMAALKTTFEKLGYINVRTYINSGNVIFQSDNTDTRALEDVIEKALAAHFSDKTVRIVVRTLAEIAATIAHFPASWQNSTGQKCNVIFLRHTIDAPTLVGSFAPKPGIEELQYVPGVLFWSARTSDLTKSTMIKLSSSPLYQEMTVRGLNTVRKIYDIMQNM
jgi:uncharacterized protein (DUF1697 family)